MLYWNRSFHHEMCAQTDLEVGTQPRRLRARRPSVSHGSGDSELPDLASLSDLEQTTQRFQLAPGMHVWGESEQWMLETVLPVRKVLLPVDSMRDVDVTIFNRLTKRSAEESEDEEDEDEDENNGSKEEDEEDRDENNSTTPYAIVLTASGTIRYTDIDGETHMIEPVESGTIAATLLGFHVLSYHCLLPIAPTSRHLPESVASRPKLNVVGFCLNTMLQMTRQRLIDRGLAGRNESSLRRS
jgi:hypothetical protein